MAHKYTAEQAKFIADNVIGLTTSELTAALNKEFELNISTNQIRGFKKNNKLRSGVDARFYKGQASHNKGKKGLGGWEPTQFKNGQVPHNYLPVGSERVNGDDYVDIKIADPKKWRAKHKLIWEEQNGPIPLGLAVIFGDGNRRNFDINNLLLVTKQQLLILNRYNLIQADAELTRTGIVIADLQQKIFAMNRKLK